MPARSLAELELEGRRVLLRVDFDVPLTPARGIADGARLRESLPTMKHILGTGAKLVLASHLGQPRGRPHPEFSLEPVGAFIADLLGQEVVLTDEPVGDGARKVVTDLRPGEVALLENLRFSPGEESNDERFARALASYGEVFVNDALAVSHRAHASVASVPRLCAQRGMGLWLEKEVRAIGHLLGEVPRPFVAIFGGGRVADKIPALESLLLRVDAFYFGGAVANTFLKARGAAVGRSLVDEDRLPWARSFLARALDRDVVIHLPRDLVAAAGTRSAGGRVLGAQRLPEDLAALDIGPESAAAFAEGIAQAHTVFWNGPMGACESEAFAAGTLAVARAVAASRPGDSVVAGADTAAAIQRAELADRIGHVSAAGPAALDILEGRRLPGLQALEN